MTLTGVSPRAFTVPFVLLLSASTSLACGFGSWFPESEDDTNDDDALDESTEGEAPEVPVIPIDEQLAPCHPNASQEAVDAEIDLLLAYQQSMHELVICGGLTTDLAGSVYSALLDAWLYNELQPPPGLTWLDGAYTSQNPASGTFMRLEAYYPFATSGHAKGDRIEFDLFETENYLVNSSSEIDQLSGRMTVWFDEPGPLVELLGQGPNPESPLVFAFNELWDAHEQFSEILLGGVIQVHDTRYGATVAYDVTVEEGTVGDVMGRVGMFVDDAQAFDDTRRLDVTEWGLDYRKQGGGKLNGSVEFEVRGGLDFDGSLVYVENDTYGVFDLVCTQETTG